MTTGSNRARAVRQLQKDVAQPRRPVRALACRPENVEAVREFVEEAGVDLPIVTDSEAPGLCAFVRGNELEERYPEQAREWARKQERRAQTSGVPRREDAQTDPEVRSPEVRIIVHRSETPQKLAVETGPEGVTVHVGDLGG